MITGDHHLVDHRRAQDAKSFPPAAGSRYKGFDSNDTSQSSRSSNEIIVLHDRHILEPRQTPKIVTADEKGLIAIGHGQPVGSEARHRLNEMPSPKITLDAQPKCPAHVPIVRQYLSDVSLVSGRQDLSLIHI